MSPETLEANSQAKEEPGLVLNAWAVQNIVYELILNYGIANPPNEVGFAFSDRILEDKTKSGVYLDIAYNWDAKVTQKRPAIFVQRSTVSCDIKEMGSITKFNEKESELTNRSINNMSVLVKCIAPDIGFVEQLSEYIRQALIYFQHIIQVDFGFRLFRVKTMSAPEIYVDAKDHFIVVLTISTVFDEHWIVKADQLKIKTVSKQIFDNILSKPLTNQ